MSVARIVAPGPPQLHRDRVIGEGQPPLHLPGGRQLAELAVRSGLYKEGVVEIATEDEVAVLHSLTGWALAEGVPLAGLEVERLTLEDVYIKLTSNDAG